MPDTVSERAVEPRPSDTVPVSAAARPAAHRTKSPRRGSPLLIAGLILVAALGGAGWAWWHWQTKPAPAATPPPVPVVVATALRQDVPVYMVGLGAVQALNTVTVKARVDGQLDTINFIEGQDVRVGDVLAQIDPRPFQAQLAQVQAARARDEASLGNARLDLRRYATLAVSQFATRQSVDTQSSLVAQLEAAIKTDQAQIDYAQIQLDYTTIRAPLSARTGVRLVDAGNIVHAADAGGLVVLTQIEPISLLFTLPEASFGAVNRAQEAAKASGIPVKVTAFSGTGTGFLGEGTLLVVNNLIDPATGTIQLKATFPNGDHALWPGQFVNARLLLETRRGAVTVPAAAVQRGPGGLYVWVVKADQAVEMHPVQVAQTAAGTAVVQSGVAAGDVVVVGGQLRLRAGTHVNATPPGGSR